MAEKFLPKTEKNCRKILSCQNKVLPLHRETKKTVINQLKHYNIMKKFFDILGTILVIVGMLLIPTSVLTSELHCPAITGVTLVAAILAMALGALAIHKATELD